MKKVLVLLANGSEDMEAVISIDILDRAGFSVTTASAEPDGVLTVKCAHGVTITADKKLVDVADEEFDCIVLPGGLPGSETFRDSALVVELIKQQICDEKWVAAICAAPAFVLAHHGLYPKAYMTGYPGTQDKIPDAYRKANKRVVVDANHYLITSQGPGTAQEFALEIVSRLAGKEKAFEVGGAMVLLPVIAYSDKSIENLKRTQE